MMKKTMSAKQIKANRNNAQQSTGPKTEAGRAASKMNAVRHGMLTQAVLVRGWKIKESSEEFAALQDRLWEELQPVGLLEEILVDQMVSTQWRLRREMAAEAGEVALSVDGGHWI